ncbi:MAG: hypothetical protein IT454_01935 [Planctomycetes bacterium]|nr:hypothetical protein [Planctomycetota bacterium]
MKHVHLVFLGLFLGTALPAAAQERRPRDKADKGEQQTQPAGPRVAQAPEKPAYEKKSEPLPSTASLASTRALFTTADADKSGKLDLKEATAAGLGPRDCTAGDLDGDKLLTTDEFLVGYSGMLARLGRPVASEVTNEAARLVAAAPAKPAVAAPTPNAPATAAPVTAAPAGSPAGKPASAPVAGSTGGAQPTPVADPKAELERKIAEALRSSDGGAAEAPRERERKAPAAPSGEATPADVAKENLNRRLRNAEVSPEEAAAERAKLSRRIDNANQAAEKRAADAKVEAPPASGAALAAGGSAPHAGKALDAKAKQATEALETRIDATGADPKAADEARAKLGQRIDNARGVNGGGAPPAATAADAPTSNKPAPAAPAPQAAGTAPDAGAAAHLDDEARKKLEQRLQATGATPEQSDAARKKLEKRIENSKQTEAAGGGAAPAEPAAKAGSDDAADGLDAPQNAKLSPQERAKAMREALEQRLKATGADEASAAAAREKLEKRIKNLEAGAASSGANAGGAATTGAQPAGGAAPAKAGKGRKAGAATPAEGGAAPAARPAPAQGAGARPAPAAGARPAGGRGAAAPADGAPKERGGKKKRDGGGR